MSRREAGVYVVLYGLLVLVCVTMLVGCVWVLAVTGDLVYAINTLPFLLGGALSVGGLVYHWQAWRDRFDI